jgi:hypothetical protein
LIIRGGGKRDRRRKEGEEGRMRKRRRREEGGRGSRTDVHRAKFTSYSTFDTVLYLKQEEYQALKWEGETVREGIRSLVLPSSLFLVVAVALGLFWRNFFFFV